MFHRRLKTTDLLPLCSSWSVCLPCFVLPPCAPSPPHPSPTTTTIEQLWPWAKSLLSFQLHISSAMCFQMFQIHVGLKRTTFNAKSQTSFNYLFVQNRHKIHVTGLLWAALIALVWFTVCWSLSSGVSAVSSGNVFAVGQSAGGGISDISRTLSSLSPVVELSLAPVRKVQSAKIYFYSITCGRLCFMLFFFCLFVWLIVLFFVFFLQYFQWPMGHYWKYSFKLWFAWFCK